MSGHPDLPTLAFIYDRCATAHKGLLDHRLAVCREYAAERRWEVAGEWVDRGNLAVTNAERPQMSALLRAMAEATATGRTVVCLIHDWGRLAHDPDWNSSMRFRIGQAGGWTETAFGETDQRSARDAAPERTS